VLAVRDDRTDRLDHFAWGVLPELAIRLGRGPGDLEREQATRAAVLSALARDGVLDVDSVRARIRTVQGEAAPRRPRPN
jgi:hypothetical protein